MKMLDMGKKESMPQVTEAKAPSAENRISYPGFSLYDNVPDALFKKDVGDTVELKVVCKINRKSINENKDNKNKDMSLDILKLGIEDNEADLGEEIKKQLE